MQHVFFSLRITFLVLGLYAGVLRAQAFDPYSRVSDPRGICRLDGPDTLPIRIFHGLGPVAERDPLDSNYVIASMQGSGIVTHLWLMYYQLPSDSLISVKIWIDDSLVVNSYLYTLFTKPHGAIRAPLDSQTSGGLVCDVQLEYKKSARITYHIDPSICCLFWGIEYRPIAEPTVLQSSTSTPIPIRDSMQRKAEHAYYTKAYPWTDGQTNYHSIGKKILRASDTLVIFDAKGPGMIREIHFHVDTSQFESLRHTWLNIYWDNAIRPSVSVPIVDFFGCGSGFTTVLAFQEQATKAGELVCYFPMPFCTNATVVLQNRSLSPVTIEPTIGYAYEEIDRSRQGYFCAQFNESAPAKWHRYQPIASMQGRGKFIGMQLAVPDAEWPNFMEGDPIIAIDSDDQNMIRYPGTEDYMNGGWYFSDSVFSLPFAGCTQLASSQYRFHYLDAYDFHTSLQFNFQHGVDNDFRATYRTVGFLYKRWTPFWPDQDTIVVGDRWNISGSGYKAFEPIKITIGDQIIATTTATSTGTFTAQPLAVPNWPRGMQRISVNGYSRPEPVVISLSPMVCSLNDSLPRLFRWDDSMLVAVAGFKPGERVSIYFDSVEATYSDLNRIANEAHAAYFNIKVPWVDTGVYHLIAKGDRGSVAIADTPVAVTRVLNFECEDMPEELADAFSDPHVYLGFWSHYQHWSNQYTHLLYPDSGMQMVLSFHVPVTDTFKLSFYNTIGSRYGNYDLYIDSEKVAYFHGFLDTDRSLPFRSAPIDGGIHFLKKGEHRIRYQNVGKDVKAESFILNADNIVLTPVTAFHPLSTEPPPISIYIAPVEHTTASVYPNPLIGVQTTLHVLVDKQFHLGSDRLSIELFDLFGKKVATVINGVLETAETDFMHDCSGLATGKYWWVVKTIKQGIEDTQTIPFVIQR